MKKILLIIGLIALMGVASAVSCGIYTPTCEELPSYVVCSDYYTVDEVSNYSCKWQSTECVPNTISECVFKYCSVASNYWGTRDDTSMHFGDVIDIFLFNYTCLGSTYWACYWNNTAVSAENISYDSVYSFGSVEGYGGVISFDKPLPLTEYSDGIQLSCDTGYLCIGNNTEYNSTSMIATTHYLRVDFYDNCSTTTSTTTTTEGTTTSTEETTTSTSGTTSSSPTSSSLTSTTGPGGGNYTIVTYDTGTLPVMNPGTTPGINSTSFGGGAVTLFGIAIQSFILICCFLIILIVMCSVKPVYFGILVAVLAGDFLIHVMQLMTIPSSLYLLINALAIINFVRGVRG